MVRAMSTAQPSFEDIVSRLETIVATLEGQETKLEEALTLFEEGMRLCKHGGERLAAAERRLEVLLADGQTAPISDAQDACSTPPA